jgi:hypothetical protein
MSIKKIMGTAASSALLLGSLALPTFAANAPATTTGPVATAPGQNKIQCFDGPTDGSSYGGKCTLKANGAKGPVTLDNTDNNPNGDYSGVYVQNTTMSGQLLSAVTQLGYTYSGTTAPTPGSLSLNVPIDTGTGIVYAFVDAYYCPGTNGVVNVVSDTNCGIWVNGVEYANWSDLATQNPTWKVAAGALPFVIAERTPGENPTSWTVSNVTLGKGGR